MTLPANPPFSEFLGRSARGGATPQQLADLVHATWQRIDAALAPVIGQKGVAALYQRSLHLASEFQPLLKELRTGSALEAMDLDALKTALATQDARQAAEAGGALLVSFHGLVVSLIGAALSAQLLGGVWTQFFGAPPAQDPPP